jgi:putative phosphoribosyl transferase
VTFVDRIAAGRQLAQSLSYLKNQDVVVLGLPRGGVPVAAEVAAALNAPLDVIVVRKLGAPDQPELAIGAVGEGGFTLHNRRLMTALSCDAVAVNVIEHRERAILAERVHRFRNGREAVNLEGRIVVVVDDGFATGATARVACHIARDRGAKMVIFAVPVCPAGSAELLPEADTFLTLESPQDFRAVGDHYLDFSQTSDDEVVRLLDEARRRILRTGQTTETAPMGIVPAATTGATSAVGTGRESRANAKEPGVQLHDVEIIAHDAVVHGTLSLAPGTRGIVIFAHGSGSSRHSPRNRYVANVLGEAGLGTLLLDLLTPDEENYRSNIFDINLLASRLIAAYEWLHHNPDTQQMRVGFFGASTGAGAALLAAADSRVQIDAIVSRGGRPDLAGEALGDVTAPTLLIVGSLDPEVLELNRWAQDELGGVAELTIIDGATHLFEEPGTLESVAAVATNWFTTYLTVPSPATEREHAR